MSEYHNKLAKLMGELIVLGLDSDDALQVIMDNDVPKFETKEYDIDGQWDNLIQSGKDMILKKMSIINRAIELLSSLIDSELYIEIFSSISGKIYVSNVDRVTADKDESGNVESITLEYMDSIFIVWVQDIVKILDDDKGFIGEGEEYDEDFKFATGLQFNDGISICIYRNEYIEEDDSE